MEERAILEGLVMVAVLALNLLLSISQDLVLVNLAFLTCSVQVANMNALDLPLMGQQFALVMVLVLKVEIFSLQLIQLLVIVMKDMLEMIVL